MFSTGDNTNIKDKIVEELGQAIVNLNKLEAKLPNVLEEIQAERDKILENIEIVQWLYKYAKYCINIYSRL